MLRNCYGTGRHPDQGRGPDWPRKQASRWPAWSRTEGFSAASCTAVHVILNSRMSRSRANPSQSLHELFDCYPVKAEISSIQFAVNSAGQVSVLMYLLEANPGILAAGVVEWHRTLDGPVTRVWRTPDGANTYMSVTGYAPECGETPIGVLAGPIPHSARIDVDLEPGRTARIEVETLYTWFGSEIAHNWPFSGVKQ